MDLLEKNSEDTCLVEKMPTQKHIQNNQTGRSPSPRSRGPSPSSRSRSRRKANIPKRKIPKNKTETDYSLVEKEVGKYVLKVPLFCKYFNDTQSSKMDTLSMTSNQIANENDSDSINFDYIMGDNSKHDNAELSSLEHNEICVNHSRCSKDSQNIAEKYVQNEIDTNRDEIGMDLQTEISANLDLQKEIEAKFIIQNEKEQNLKIPLLVPNLESKKSKSKRVTCELCNKTFGRPSDLRRHSLLHTGERRHTCEDCQKTFTQRYHLIRHVKKVHKKELENLICGLCSETFNSEYLLVRHVKRHGVMTFSCDVCNKEFKTKRQMKEHSSSLHAGIKPFQCTQCGKVFSRKYHLDRHVMIHTGVRDYQCEYCGKDFSTKGNVMAHVKRVHMNIKEFTCGVCEKGFFSLKDLRTHLKKHTGEKPYQCEICMKKFSAKVNLEWHERIHSGERPYQCEICDKSYTRMPHLIRHQQEGLCARRAIHGSYFKTGQTAPCVGETYDKMGSYNPLTNEYLYSEMNLDEDRHDKVIENDNSCTSSKESDDFGQSLSN